MAKKSLKNVVVTYNGTDITPYLNKASKKATVEAIDTTNFASTGAENTAGLPSWTVEVGGMWELALDNVIGPDTITPPATLRTLVVKFGPTGGQVVLTWTGAATTGAFLSNYEINPNNPKGMIEWSGTLTTSGAPTRTTA